MKRPWTLTAKLAATGITFLALALASIGVTLWVTWNLEGGAAAVNEAGRMRMQSYRLALSLASGAPPAESRALARGFDESIALLASGDPSRPLFVPWSAATRSGFADVQSHWERLRARWLGPVTPAQVKADAQQFVRLVDRFVAAIEAQIARWTTVLQFFQLAMMALAIGSAVVMLYAGYLLVLSPLARLQRGLAAVQRGQLATRVEVATRDEFGELAAGFNAMAATLQALYGSLEEKVREKTRRLEVKRQRLADLYEVSAFVAQAPSLDVLAHGFVRHVRRIAGADAAAVRWCGEGNQRYLMLAGDGLPEDFARQENCLETAACHCGQRTGQARTRVIPIRLQDAAPSMHCHQAGFATVVSIPVQLHDRMLGELSLFYRHSTDIGEEERELLDTLATHLAGAMESLRAAALERAAAVAEERGLLARELHDSIAQSLAFMKIQVQLLRQAAQRGDAERIASGIGELDTGVRECYADVRELLLHFRTRTSAEDIAPALRTTLQKFEHQTGLPARLEMEGHAVPLAPDVQVQVLHIIQEALSNVRKHARATQVEVRVSCAPHWRFEVRDDGVGFDAAGEGLDQTRVGLRIMQERAQRIGARLQLASGAQGTTVTLELAGAPATAPLAELEA